MRGLTRRWRRRHPENAPAASTDPRLLVRVLAARQLDGPDAEAFLDPSLLRLTDPSAIRDIDRAAQRLLEAIDARQRIVIYGDYDVDGITATAILRRMLASIAPDADVETYIPHRVEEGYGLNEQAIRKLADEGAAVIVSVDCGVTAREPARAAREVGVDLIITDHHNPPEDPAELPDAFAIVHPRLGNDDGEELCGAGVAYKLAWRLATLSAGDQRARPAQREVLVELLALASLGTIADMVPLIGDNRIIARHGLSRCRSSSIVGLRALVASARLDGSGIDAESVGFRLAPRLNACGRLAHSRDAVELLLTDDEDRAIEIAAELCRLNDERRATEKSITEHALALAIEHGLDTDDRRAVVLAHEDWHPGVVGIVCSRVVEKLRRPTLLLQRKTTDAGEVCSGSGRSIEGFNLHAALSDCAEHLVKFGGHDAAAGLTLAAENFEAFREAFIERVNAELSPEDLITTTDYDTDATIDEITLENTVALGRLGPFGAGNPKIRLRLVNARLAEDPRPMGADGKHIDLRLEDADRRSPRVLRACAWNWSEHVTGLRRGVPVEALIAPKINEWRGRRTCEAELIDVAPRHADAPIVVVSRNAQSVGAAT